MSDVPGLDALLDGLWTQHRHHAVARVQVLEAYSARLQDGAVSGEDRRTAEREAHTLVGTLGSYGRPGSASAAALEALLGSDPAVAPDPGAVAALVAALRTAVDG